jgi:hypothetical protein
MLTLRAISGAGIWSCAINFHIEHYIRGTRSEREFNGHCKAQRENIVCPNLTIFGFLVVHMSDCASRASFE